MLINGKEINVNTVMVKDAPAYVPTRELVDRLDEEARELLPKYSDAFIEGNGLQKIWDTFFERKAWLIRAMEKMPGYNGNLQIIMRGQNLSRRIDVDAVFEFCVYVKEFCHDNAYWVIRGKKVNRAEYDKALNEIDARIRRIGFGFPDPITNKVAVWNMSAEWRDIHYARRQMDDIYCFAIQMIDIVKNEIMNGNTVVTEDSLREFNELIDNFRIEKFRFSIGLKLSRLVGKLAKLIGIDKHVDIRNVSFYDQSGEYHERLKDMGWNYQYAKFCDSVNPLIVKGTAVISVNPIDYWTMSFGTNWASCHTIDKLNRRRIRGHHYHGCYCGGTESYMLDQSSVVFYFLPESFNGDKPEFEAKVKRCMFYLGEDKLIQSRVYPDGRDGGDASLAPDIRAIMQKLVAEMFNVPNLWKLEKGTCVCDEVTTSRGPHYRDYLTYEDCNVSFMRRIDGYINRKDFRIGSEIICPECGEIHYEEENIYCDRCADGCKCTSCGDSIDPEYSYHINGECYCDNCVSRCDECGEMFINELDETDTYGGTWLSHYRRNVCHGCLREEYTWSDEENMYIQNDSAIVTEEGSVYLFDSDSWHVCNGCEEIHDEDNMVEIDEEWYCEDCAEEHQGNEE